MVYKRYTHDMHFGTQTNSIVSGWLVNPMIQQGLLSGTLTGTADTIIASTILDNMRRLAVVAVAGKSDTLIQVTTDDSGHHSNNILNVVDSGLSSLFTIGVSGALTLATLDKPTIHDFSNATHAHSSSATGGAFTIQNLSDVESVTPANLDFFRYDSSNSDWSPAALAFSSPLSISVPIFGGVDSTVSIQDASTSQKGAAKFNGDHFTASAGTISANLASDEDLGVATFDATDFSVSSGNVTLNDIEDTVGQQSSFTMSYIIVNVGQTTMNLSNDSVQSIYAGWVAPYDLTIKDVAYDFYAGTGSSPTWTMRFRKNHSGSDSATMSITGPAVAFTANTSTGSISLNLDKGDALTIVCDGGSIDYPAISAICEIVRR